MKRTPTPPPIAPREAPKRSGGRSASSVHRDLSRGMTLIELLVALAVFAVLGTLTWRGTTQMIDSRQILEHELQRWRELGRALHVIENELLQAVGTGVEPARRPAAMVHSTAESGSRLSFLALTGGALEQVTFSHAGDRLEWLRRPAGAPESALESDPLVERVRTVRWQFLDTSGWSTTWPSGNERAKELPRAVRIDLDLADLGTVSRTYALR